MIAVTLAPSDVTQSDVTQEAGVVDLGCCVTCGEPLRLSPFGPLGQGGVCRNPFNPNDDDEGQHLVPDHDTFCCTDPEADDA